MPDTAHDWVSRSEQNFAAYLKYLKVEGYRVIALRDLAEFVDADVAPADFRSVIESRQKLLKSPERHVKNASPRDSSTSL